MLPPLTKLLFYRRRLQIFRIRIEIGRIQLTFFFLFFSEYLMVKISNITLLHIRYNFNISWQKFKESLMIKSFRIYFLSLSPDPDVRDPSKKTRPEEKSFWYKADCHCISLAKTSRLTKPAFHLLL